MTWAHLLVATLISMSNLTHFLDRLITDGQYKTIVLIRDDASVRDTNFISELTDLGFGKYSMVIVNSNDVIYERKSYTLVPFDREFGGMQVIMLHYDESRKTALTELLIGQNLYSNIQNVVYLIGTQSDVSKSQIWRIFNRAQDYIRYVNCSVIFYETGKSVEKKSIEIFAIKYKPEEYYHSYTRSDIDVENSVFIDDDQVNTNETNLHEKIFGPIYKKPNLDIITVSASMKSVTKITEHRSNTELMNLGNTDFYLSNFIARNLRGKEVALQQLLEHHDFYRRYRFQKPKNYICNASNEKTYAEMYNSSPKEYRPIKRCVSTV